MNKLFYHFALPAIFLSVLLTGFKVRAQSNNEWTSEKADQWFKKQEWLNSRSIHQAAREYDQFGREISETYPDSNVASVNNKELKLKPHKSINKVEFAKQFHANKIWWDEAFAFLKETDLSAIKPGKYLIDGDNVFATVTEGSPRRMDTTKWESHHNYQDIHYVISGKEQIGITNIDSVTVANEYNAARDLIFYTGKGKYYIAEPGTFFIFFPQDAHRPNLQLNGYTDKKIVIKVRRSN